MRAFVLLCSVCLLSATPLRLAASRSPETVVPTAAPTILAQIKQIEESILSHRRAITRGRFRILTTWPLDSTQSPEERTLYFDGHRARSDLKCRDVVQVVCFGDHYFYRYNTGPAKDNRGPFPLEVYERKQVERSQHDICDPLKMMLYPGWLAMAKHVQMDTFIASPDRTDFILKDVEWDGEQGIEVSFKHAAGGRMSYVVVPARGYNVVRMESLFGEGKDACPNLIECTLTHVRDQVWFPKTVRYRRIINGAEVVAEDLAIEVLSCNEPLDPRFFEPATMNMPAGTIVLKSPADPRGQMKWDGQQMVVMTQAEKIKRMYKQPEAGSDARRLYFTLSSVSAIIGVVVLWWWYRRRPTPTSK